MNLAALVALRKESVDRNSMYDVMPVSAVLVALRKESVDRNNRRFRAINDAKIVALRKESVDRNTLWEVLNLDRWLGRSPQGERG